MKKLLIISFIVAVGVFFLVGKLEGDSKLFANALPSNMNETNEIKEITIYEVKPTGKPRSISLTEKEDITKILKAGEAMELKEANEFVNSGYLLLLQGSKEYYTMTVDKDGYIDMDGHEEHYEIKGDNELFHVIQGLQDNWELLDDEDV
ncbi:hypothetical protein [Oceanobacillus sp. CFH 90083]|uniref:hypothetical protein n=1 Tax=Oceanobacillus sp. CFH 90083 TaxID=2592336 RepID=UPI00128E1D1E|nr:hypothetical protein [Oceanobacillus sp. CFH 90083]